MRWANNRIRVMYFGAIGDRRMIGKKWNDQSIIAQNFDPHDPIHRSKLEDTETLFFKRSSIYKHEIKVDFDPILNGMNCAFTLFASHLTKNATAYNNWVFETPTIYDDLWFDANATHILFKSTSFRIGKE